ncbi:unnamed protein product [Paramecium sonneborni]|uniref:Calpain catalytic domain-containing protein n=1 Tax=Paramecium sonneborni TaxID=65129 RepID=A0A8S1QY71_9CILI|nr:unnamed protein product [Paramecium sonneborni]
MGCTIYQQEKFDYDQSIQYLFNEPYKNNHFKQRLEICNQPEFLDETFQRINMNLSQDQKRFQPQKNYKWKRLTQQNIDHNLCHDFRYTQIRKGELNNNNFLNGLRILSFQDITIKKVFLTKSIKNNSCLILILNQQGLWQQIIIDDYLPYNMNDYPLFSYYDGNDCWVQLIEKAFAKIYGCFDKLEQIVEANEIIRDITGAPYLILDVEEFIQKVKNSQNKQWMFYLMNEKKEIFLFKKFEEKMFCLDLSRDVQQQINDFQNYQLYYIPFDPQYIQIVQQISIPIRNQQVKYVIEMKVNKQSHSFITVSQRDLKFGCKDYYGQLHMIIYDKNNGNNKELKRIYSKYQQVRDLTIECDLAIGQYLIYIEAFWDQQTDYSLNIQSYGSGQVFFKQLEKMEEKEKLELLHEMIIYHSVDQNKSIYGNDQLYSVKSQIGRYKYLLFENKTFDLTLKINLQYKLHLVMVNYPYNDLQVQQLQILPNERKLLTFQILLEKNDKHQFEVQEKDFEILERLRDNEIIEKAMKEPTQIIYRNSEMKIYNYRLEDECALVYVNDSEQKYIEQNKIKLINLSYKGNKNPGLLHIELQPKEKQLFRFYIVDRNEKQYEFECNQQYRFE